MTTSTIPVRLGPGSQPLAPEDQLDFIPMPSSMTAYRAPLLADDVRLARAPRAAACLEEVARRLDAWRDGDGVSSIDLLGLDGAELALLDDVLGEGEVSIVHVASPRARIQESIFAGVWRLQLLDADGATVGQQLEVGPVPDLVGLAVEEAPRTAGELPTEPPAGVCNALPVLVELVDRSGAHPPGAPAHVVNLTLLPFAEADHAFLDEHLGVGALTMLSRGFGNCRIDSTRHPRVWRVRYFNSMSTPLLDTLEVVDVPAVACAAPEDIAASAARLRGVLETLS